MLYKLKSEAQVYYIKSQKQYENTDPYSDLV